MLDSTGDLIMRSWTVGAEVGVEKEVTLKSEFVIIYFKSEGGNSKEFHTLNLESCQTLS